MSHTPGPWQVHREFHDRVVVNGSCVYQVRDMTTEGGQPSRADTLLMAAAPELLEALRSAKGTIEYLLANNDNGPAYNCLDVAAAAIAKAEGRVE